MSGIIGCAHRKDRELSEILRKGQSLLRHADSYQDDPIWLKDGVACTRTHLGVIQKGPQPYSLENRLFVWMDGEFYNQDGILSRYKIGSCSDPELIAHLYDQTGSWEFLKDIDGIFAAVIFDPSSQQVHLINDRYGLKPLYWNEINANFAWSSEVKGFLAFPDFTPKIDPLAVKEFFSIGYLLENRTWLQGVELLPPASILTWSLKSKRRQMQTYWAWSEIESLKGKLDEEELAEELGRLFVHAVHRRINPGEKIGITLSGGLDSRAILAAVPDEYKSLHTFTFSKKDGDDLRIAQRVSTLKGAHHHTMEINAQNWLNNRILGVWLTDGQFNLMHMHGVEHLEAYPRYVDVNLNGFLGDAILGGSYLDDSKWSLPEKVNQRGRRFINNGPVLLGSQIINRRPFLDNDLLSFTCSIPEALRQNSYIYNKMLLRTFPEFFRTIPWQKTGCPISWPNHKIKVFTLARRAITKAKREVSRFGFLFADAHSYTNYSNWIRQQPARSIIEQILLAKSPLYAQYLPVDDFGSIVQRHMNNKANHASEICLLLTFEIWLGQIFRKEFRDVGDVSGMLG